MIEKAVRARLAGFAGLSALVATRVHPLPVPENSPYPLVSYVRVSTVRPSAMGADIGRAVARIQVDSWGRTPLEALEIAEQVRAALQRWSGTGGGVVVDGSYLENQLTLYESEVEKYRVVQDFLMWYRE